MDIAVVAEEHAVGGVDDVHGCGDVVADEDDIHGAATRSTMRY